MCLWQAESFSAGTLFSTYSIERGPEAHQAKARSEDFARVSNFASFLILSLKRIPDGSESTRDQQSTTVQRLIQGGLKCPNLSQ